jgi:predicted P-loop ATPase
MDALSPRRDAARAHAHNGAIWKSDLLVTKQGEPKALLANAAHALRSAPEWHGVLAYDQFSLRTVMLRAPPWALTWSDWTPRGWMPDDDLRTTEWLQFNNINVGLAITQQAIEMVAHRFLLHPVRDFLSGIVWDGTPRLDFVFADYFGAQRNLYTATAARISFIAAVARIMEPGCKVDTVPILEGEQGTMKSTAIKILFEPWFTDEISDLGTKDAAMQTAGVWAIELAELDSMNRVENSRIKSFISRLSDRFRPPYGRRLIECDLQCVFWVSTNSDRYLRDETGGRRFLPIKTSRIDVAGLERDRDQIFAEAACLYAERAPWWLENPKALRAAQDEQRERLQYDPWEDDVAAILNSAQDHSDRPGVSIGEILIAIGIPLERQTQTDANRVARILKSKDLNRRQVRINGVREWRYR